MQHIHERLRCNNKRHRIECARTYSRNNMIIFFFYLKCKQTSNFVSTVADNSGGGGGCGRSGLVCFFAIYFVLYLKRCNNKVNTKCSRALYQVNKMPPMKIEMKARNGNNNTANSTSSCTLSAYTYVFAVMVRYIATLYEFHKFNFA